MNKIITHEGLISESDFQSETFNSDRTIYEVIRVIEGVGIFLEDHFHRLLKSIQTQSIQSDMNFGDFRQKIEELVLINKKLDGNVKFVYLASESNTQWAFYFIPHYYPTVDDYRNGVSTNVLFIERKNPNAKIIQNTIREKANQLIADQNLYEVLLVNRDGQITEGSRSNVFFIKNDVFFTAPESMVLVGITRQKVIECIRQLGFSILEEAVPKSDIFRCDAVFLTGTSPKVLPVRSIGNQKYPTSLKAVSDLMNIYDKMIVQYVRHEKKNRRDDSMKI